MIMKNLSQLLTVVKPLQVADGTDVPITDLINDSRLASPGAMFVAVKGVAVDSHRFIADVVTTTSPTYR